MSWSEIFVTVDFVSVIKLRIQIFFSTIISVNLLK